MELSAVETFEGGPPGYRIAATGPGTEISKYIGAERHVCEISAADGHVAEVGIEGEGIFQHGIA
jgi:hypothetical protein